MTGKFMSMKNSIDANGDRTGDLLACSAVPEPTAPLRTPEGRNSTVSKHVCLDPYLLFHTCMAEFRYKTWFVRLPMSKCVVCRFPSET